MTWLVCFGKVYSPYSQCEALFLLFSYQVISYSWWPRGLQHAGSSCLSPSPRSLPKFMSIELVMPSNHLILCCPFLHLHSIFLSIMVFSNELAIPIRWPKYWSFKLTSVLSMNIQIWFPLGLTGLISLMTKGSEESSPAPQCSIFLMAQLSHVYMAIGKTIALTIWTFISKVVSLLFHTLSWFVITFLPRSNHLLISWL